MADENLMQIKGVGEKIATKLKEGGFDTVKKVASASEDELIKAGLIQTRVRGIIASAKDLLPSPKEQKWQPTFWRFG
jgi:3-methyladenine DNA glycosylase/8-oxoguanine DNA glycosylase